MTPENIEPVSERNFILQQGFESPETSTCHSRYSSLLFQPRIVGPIVLLGVILQSPILFLALAVVLWWSVLFPAMNPFDAVYNMMRKPEDAIRLTPAPMPRRFAQGMAASFALLIGLTLLAGWTISSYVLQGMMLIAVTALVFGRFCLGSFVYHILRGEVDFAMRTLPWSPKADG